MVMVPEFVTTSLFDAAVAKTLLKRNDGPSSLRFETFATADRYKQCASAAMMMGALCLRAFTTKSCLAWLHGCGWTIPSLSCSKLRNGR